MIVRFIELITLPNKLTYNTGDEFDLTGCYVKATFDDGSSQNVTSELTVTPNPLVSKTTSVVLHYTGESEEDENHDFTIVVDNVKVYDVAAWKFLDGNGLSYFYNQLLHTFIPKSSSQGYLTNDYYNKVMVYDNTGKVGYSEVTKDDISLIKDISSILPSNTEDSDKTFNNLINYMVTYDGFVNDDDVIGPSIIEAILNETYDDESGDTGTTT